LQAETLFELFAFGFLGGALLGVLLFQAGDFRLGRGAQATPKRAEKPLPW